MTPTEQPRIENVNPSVIDVTFIGEHWTVTDTRHGHDKDGHLRTIITMTRTTEEHQ